jgi:hypothetical protein
MLRSSALLVTCAVAASLTAACALKNNASLASDTSGAEDVNGTESDLESLGSSFLGPDGASVATAQSWSPGKGDIALQDNGSQTTGNPGFFFQPAGCLQVTVDKVKEQASYVFNGCTGPLGLVELNGTVDVGWSTTGGKLTITFSAADFHINRATITQWSAQAVVTANGSARELVWTGMLSGTTGSGRAFQRTNNKDLKWTVGVACLAISGQSTGNILKAKLQTSVIDYQRCADSCPQAGSEIQVKNLDNGDSIDIKYAGGPSATLTLNGKSEQIGLACGE